MDKFVKKIKAHYPKDCPGILSDAFDFAEKAHSGQNRDSGEPYFTHPVGVADILIDLGLDTATICAALLHDVVEDTAVTEEMITEKFGAEIAELVRGVTKLDKITFTSKEEEQAENFRKMFFAMAKDTRVILIKLADRLHNMRTIGALSQARQNAMAKETIEIYAPLASRLGLSYLKCDLEDLALKVMHREDYEKLVNDVNLKRAERQELVNKITSQLVAMLNELNIKGEVSGRPKHFYSIYRKMTSKNKTFEQIYDLTAVRVVVESVSDCYEVLGRIHTFWKPVPGRFKDYIAMPKPNNYQSLHTTVMTNYGMPFEIQIRTFEMHRVAEYGIAAHWKYKENRTKSDGYDEKLGWLKEAVAMQGDLDNSKEFLESMKTDLYGGEVFIFTPKGDVVSLPEGSTPIDFAYSVHTDIGHKCVSAKINGRIVPLTSKLSTGDFVEIITGSSAKGPSRDWLKYIKTTGAKAKIKSYFKKQMKEENIKLGKDMLEAEAKRKGIALSQLMQPKWLDIVMQRMSLSSVDDMYAAVGYGGITTGQVLLKLIDMYKKEQAAVSREFKTINRKSTDIKDGIVIKGHTDLFVRVAKCCSPVPGDNIIGFISRGRGIVAHRTTCPNVKGMETERLIEASWALSQSMFGANIQIIGNNSPGFLAQVTAVISERKMSIESMSARLGKQGEAIVNLSVTVTKIEDLDSLMTKLEQLPIVHEVRRITS